MPEIKKEKQQLLSVVRRGKDDKNSIVVKPGYYLRRQTQCEVQQTTEEETTLITSYEDTLAMTIEKGREGYVIITLFPKAIARCCEKDDNDPAFNVSRNGEVHLVQTFNLLNEGANKKQTDTEIILHLLARKLVNNQPELFGEQPNEQAPTIRINVVGLDRTLSNFYSSLFMGEVFKSLDWIEAQKRDWY